MKKIATILQKNPLLKIIFYFKYFNFGLETVPIKYFKWKTV